MRGWSATFARQELALDARAALLCLSLYVDIEVALRAKEIGIKVMVAGSAEGFRDTKPTENHYDKLGPRSTLGFVGVVWTTILTVAEMLVERGVQLQMHLRTTSRATPRRSTGSTRRWWNTNAGSRFCSYEESSRASYSCR